MKLATLRKGSTAVAAQLAAARSARNRATRAAQIEAAEERASARRYKRARAREDRERATNKGIRVTVAEHERPRTKGRIPHKLFYRLGGKAIRGRLLTGGATSGTRSVHFAQTARGFASKTGRRWRTGEGERAAQYITREEALEGGEAGWWSTIAQDRNELVAFHRASEALERHDRANANVYVTEIVALPASATARQRRRMIRRYCRYFDKRGLPYTVAMHKPDPQGDVRNFHVHIVYSLRPTTRLGPYDWRFAVSKVGDVNTPEGIAMRRKLVVDAINATLRASGSTQRYTHLSNRARGMAPPAPKIGQKRNWVIRRLADRQAGYARLVRLKTMMDRLGEGIQTIARAHVAQDVAKDRLTDNADAIGKALGGQNRRLAFCRTHLMIWLNNRCLRQRPRLHEDALAKAKAAIEADLAAATALIDAADQRVRGAGTVIRKTVADRLRAVRGRVGIVEITAMRLEQLLGGVRDRLERCRAILQAHDTRVPALPTPSLGAGDRVDVAPNISPEPTIGLAEALREREVQALARIHAQTFVKLAALNAKPSRDANGRWTIDTAGLSAAERRAVEHPALAAETQRRLAIMAADPPAPIAPEVAVSPQPANPAPAIMLDPAAPSVRRQPPMLSKGPNDVGTSPPSRPRGPER
ncbi:MobA/MobL family protein [uncultured Sphingomonas sp.]|uniref:MobA/MobL family protein n=1 Tax=uncultured Sphingomonas sp. TaxID=158754 RepID=UPI00261BDD88|nr:MobA/MobL family protein [uncultured Sphingomonas sp.]